LVLAAALTDEHSTVRVAAAAGLGTVGERADALAELAEDLDALVRAASFEAAANLGCVPPLDSLADVRKAVVQSLSRWADQVSADLKAVFDDEDADVRAYARRALG
jgi:HEAT repeat protein